MEAKFTPGPWKQGFRAVSDFDGDDKNGRPIRSSHTVWQYIESPDGSKVATCGIYVQGQNKPAKRIPADQGEANATLIAAAPDMYEALRMVQRSLSALDASPLAEAVDAALAKAVPA